MALSRRRPRKLLLPPGTSEPRDRASDAVILGGLLLRGLHEHRDTADPRRAKVGDVHSCDFRG